MLKVLAEEDSEKRHTSQTDEILMETWLMEKAKRLRTSLTVLAKASHRKIFMETCHTTKTPPRSMCLWVEPHIYHSDKHVETEWRDIDPFHSFIET